MNIIKNIKKLSSIFTASLMSILPISTLNVVYAANGEIQISAKYDTNIQPITGDVFVISYNIEGQTQTATMEIDTSIVSSTPYIGTITEASYQITNIEYNGSNESLKETPYGVNNLFSTMGFNNGQVEIAIGSEAVQNLSTKYTVNTLIKNSNNIVESTNEGIEEQSTIENSLTNENIETNIDTDNNGNTDTNEIKDEVTSEENYGNNVVPPEETTDEDKIEKEEKKELTEKEKEDRKNSLLLRLIILVILAIGGFLTIFILHKMGKF